MVPDEYEYTPEEEKGYLERAKKLFEKGDTINFDEIDEVRIDKAITTVLINKYPMILFGTDTEREDFKTVFN